MFIWIYLAAGVAGDRRLLYGENGGRWNEDLSYFSWFDCQHRTYFWRAPTNIFLLFFKSEVERFERLLQSTSYRKSIDVRWDCATIMVGETICQWITIAGRGATHGMKIVEKEQGGCQKPQGVSRNSFRRAKQEIWKICEKRVFLTHSEFRMIQGWRPVWTFKIYFCRSAPH